MRVAVYRQHAWSHLAVCKADDDALAVCQEHPRARHVQQAAIHQLQVCQSLWRARCKRWTTSARQIDVLITRDCLSGALTTCTPCAAGSYSSTAGMPVFVQSKLTFTNSMRSSHCAL